MTVAAERRSARVKRGAKNLLVLAIANTS